jgi:glutamate carboxypeptidase
LDDEIMTTVAINVMRMIAGIREWVEIESPTTHVRGVNTMIDAVCARTAGLELRTERIDGAPAFGDILVLRTAAADERPGILLLSHVDTVHPLGALAASPFRQDGDRLYGPGIYDMKGGAYLGVEAFCAVVKAGTARLPLVYLITPDEELGSPFSRALIEAHARRARYVLVTEPARDGGKVVTSRKGVGRFEALASGMPAHAGTRHQAGHSAIREMARQVLAIEAMTDYRRGITTTVGTILGGTAPNVVPQHCRIAIDLRVPDEDAGRQMVARICGLESIDPHVTLAVSGGMNRPPYKKSPQGDALYRHAQGLARELGFKLDEAPMSGGGSDANFCAALGVPTLDGLGIDGDGAHTTWECALASSIAPRTRLMRRLLETLS